MAERDKADRSIRDMH
jgi:hypothetical protein